MPRNKGARNSFLEKKSWKAGNGHKGFWKRYVSKAARRGAKQEIKNA